MKEKVIAYLVKGGCNINMATEITEKNLDIAMRCMPNATVRKLADFCMCV